MIPVSDLKQWAYCPRIVFYHQFMAGSGVTTFKMRAGALAQDVVERLESRRTFERYGLVGAERHFSVRLASDRLRLSGTVDLLLVRGLDAWVVDFKLTSGEPGDHHIAQLAAYAVLVEAELGKQVGQCFLARLSDDEVFAVDMRDPQKARVLATLKEIAAMQEREELPEPTAFRGRCRDCEYVNLCADVW